MNNYCTYQEVEGPIARFLIYFYDRGRTHKISEYHINNIVCIQFTYYIYKETKCDLGASKILR